MNRKRWIGVAVVAIAAVLVVWLWPRGSSPSPSPSPATSTTTSTSTSTTTSTRGVRDPKAAAGLAGTVRDQGGAAVAGAWVCAQVGWGDDDTSAEDRHEPRCTVAGEDGRWQLAAWPGKWIVTAGAEGMIPATWQDERKRGYVRLGVAEHRDGIDLTLEGGAAQVTGVVLDITGGPIAGAVVEAGSGWGSDRGACITRSGDDGRFTCWCAPGEVSGSATAEGYTSGWGEGFAPGGSLELYLTPEATLGGVVVTAGTGKPVAGARVVQITEWGDGDAVYSDGDGRFRFTRVWPARYKVAASVPGGYGEAAESVQVGIAESRDDLVVEIHPATIVTGQVVVAAAAGDPAPAEDCYVMLSRADGRRYADSGDADGRVRFEAVQPGTYEVQISCERLVPRAEYPDLEVDAVALDRQWQVDAGLVLRGVVVDEHGAPIARAGVSARNVGGDPRGARGRGWETADRDGRFEIAGLSAGSVEVSASSDDHAEDPEPTKLEMTADAEVTLRLSSGGTIAGVVVDQDGAPVDDARVFARGERWGGWARNKDDGSFEMKGLTPGSYRVEASRGWGEAMRKPGSTDDDLQGERVTVKAGKTSRVELVVESARGRITGRVLDAAGRPVTDAFVKAERESEAAGSQRGAAKRSARWGWVEQPAVTDLDGRFTVERLAPGKYTVLAYRRGGSEASAEGVAVGSDVVLTITPTASLAGTVVTGGAAPREVRVAIADHDTGTERSESFFLRGGAWVIRDLPAGKYDISASAPEGSAALEDVVLGEGEHKTGITLTLQKKVTMRGRVVDADTGAPVEGMSVSASLVDGASGGYVFYMGGGGDKDHISDGSGAFTVRDVPQGRVRVGARPRDWSGASEYSYGARIVVVGEVDPVEIGDVPVLKKRTGRGKRGGDLGFTLHELPPDTDPAAVVMKVAAIRPGGPAADSGLRVDDVIVSVDGRDVRGEQSWQYWPTASVPEGTTVSFGLERGETVKIRAGAPE